MSEDSDLPQKSDCVCRKIRKPRPYKCDDAPRLMGYAAKKGCSKRGLLVKSAVSMGVGWIFCVAADTVKSFSLLSKLILEVGGALAITQVLEVLLAILTRGKWAKFPFFTISLVVIILVLNNLVAIIKAIMSVLEKYGDMQELADILDSMCEEVKALGGKAVGSVEELVELLKELR